jgi:hypothetical protein
VLVVPAAARTIDEALAVTFEVYQRAAELRQRKYGMRALKADEAMLADAVAAIEAAGLVPGRDVALAVDVASSHFFSAGRYHLDGEALTTGAMIDRLAGWLDRRPDQGGLDHAVRAAGEIQPAARDRDGNPAAVGGLAESGVSAATAPLPGPGSNSPRSPERWHP